MIRMRFLSWLLLTVLTAAYITGPLEDPDLWWHLTVGRWILAHGEVPVVDLWNQYGIGKPWRAYSWSNEVVLAFTELTWGPWGLLTLKLLLAVGISVSFAAVYSVIARDGFIGVMLGVFTATACFNHFTLRPQSFVWILFALLLLLLDQIAQQGVNARRLLGVAAVMCLWANTQITTIIGLVAVVVWFGSLRLYRELLIVGSVAVLGTLLTPYGGGEWLTFASKTSHPLMLRAIAEFQPATIMQFSTGFLVLITFLLLLCAHLAPTLIPVGLLVGGGGFLLAALAVVKFHPFAMIYLGALMAYLWRARAGSPMVLGNLGEGITKLRALVLWLPKEGTTFLLLVLVILQIKPLYDLSTPIRESVVPVAAVNFIQDRKLPLPLLHDFGRGGYVMYRFADRQGTPSYLVPIDGRTNVTPPEVWKKYLQADLGERSWKEYFDLVKPETVLWRRDSPLLAILTATNDWCQVFETVDANEMGYVVFLKRERLEQRPTEFSSPNCPAQILGGT